MNAWVEAAVGWRRLWLLMAALTTLVGVGAWFNMPRAEDPRLPERNGLILTTFPGADAAAVERLVTKRLEDELAEVSEVEEVRAIVRADVSVLVVQLGENVTEVEEAWRQVEDAADRARAEMPDGVQSQELTHDFADAEAIVLVVSGTSDPVLLDAAADRVEDVLLGVPGAARTERAGVQGTQVTVSLDPAVAYRYGVSASTIARLLDNANTTVPGGAIRVDGRTVVLRPSTEQRDLAELRSLPVVLSSGAAVPLGEIARIELEGEDPPTQIARHNGAPAVVVSLVPKPNLDLVTLGQRADVVIESLKEELAPLELEVFADQPKQVQARLDELSWNLLSGVAIVAGMLLLTMGWRLGLVVSSVVPLVTFSTVALYAGGGGVLQQLSVAALVIALGLLVDNAIVVAEAVQARLDEGEGRWDAARGAVRDLTVPLATATGTTLAAFVPMLLSPGVTADFTRAIPIVVMVALALSYVFAVLVTPVLAAWLLRRKPSSGPTALEVWGGRVASLSANRPWWVLGAVGALVLSAGSMGLFVDSEFFPYADRARFVATIEMPEGTDILETERVASRLESWALRQAEVQGADLFVGRAAPRFYYNIQDAPRAPHVAQLVLTTTSKRVVPGLVDAVRRAGRDLVPEAVVTARPLQQGPPTGSPIEIRVRGDKLSDLQIAAESVSAALREVDGAVSVRHDLGLGVPTLSFEIDDAEAGRRGIGRAQVGLAVLGQTQGIPAQPIRAWDDPVPVQVRGPGRDTSAVALAASGVDTSVGSVPLGTLAQTEVRWAPAALYRRNRQREVTVAADLADGAAFGSVIAALRPQLGSMSFPPGVSVSLGGEAEASAEANSAILGAVPLGAALLLGCLLLEFNSFRRMGIVLVTVPLAVAGVLPGLVFGGQPFGFMSLLGVIALVGIVVNNAIVLLDVIDRALEDGRSIHEAVGQAVRARLRPILLTTGTTIAGLIPLALSESSLWPPLAWALISGLAASTLLTLFAVPALARLVLRASSPSSP
jgi:multidrug efflux pump subunit AcrB